MKTTCGEIELEIEVVVAERVVLRRIEHLEQRRGRIAAPVGADLVDLVEQDHRVHRPGVAQGPDEPARQRADVRAPVAADLGLVADAAERHPDELASERTGDRLADRGLAGAGRADEGEDRAGPLVRLDPALLAQLADGDVLDDPVLDVLEALVVGVEHLTGVHGVEALLGALAPRHGEDPVEVVADHRRLGRAVALALEPGELALDLLADLLGQLRLLQLAPVLLDDGRVVLAELLPDRIHLTPQDVLALLLRGALLDVVADAAAHLHLCEALTLELDRQREPLLDVERLEQLDLLLEGEVGRVADGVGERSGLADRADEGRDAAVVAAQLEDLLDDRAVLALELARARVGLVAVRALVDLDAQLSVRVGLGGADDAAVQAAERHRAAAAGQPDAVGHLGDRADARIVVFVAGDEQHALLGPDIHGQGHVHVREDDDVLQGYEQHRAQLITPF